MEKEHTPGKLTVLETEHLLELQKIFNRTKRRIMLAMAGSMILTALSIHAMVDAYKKLARAKEQLQECRAEKAPDLKCSHTSTQLQTIAQNRPTIEF